MVYARHVDLVVIGAGPAGYSAAFRAADLGRSVVLIDARSSLGGVCLNEGCIPSKALLHAGRAIHEASRARDWGIVFGPPDLDLDVLRAKKDAIVSQLTSGLGHLARKRKVDCVSGRATFLSSNELSVSIDESRSETWSFTHAIIATGSVPVTLPGWPVDDRIWDSGAALEVRFVPQRLAIVGGGIIGLEMATIYSALGSVVTVIEIAGQLAPGAEAEAAAVVRRSLAARNCKIFVATKVTGVEAGGDEIKLTCDGKFAGTIEVDAVVQAVGRRAETAPLSLQSAGVGTRSDGTVMVDDQCRTSCPTIFAVGDVTGPPMLAHRAAHQGKVAAEVACDIPSAFDTSFVPSVAYTDPELAWVGPTAQQLSSTAQPFKTIKFPWAASGRNLTSGGGEGLTVINYHPESGRVLSATIVGASAGELLSELTLALELGATLSDLALTIHAHPTLSETTSFAAQRGVGSLVDL